MEKMPALTTNTEFGEWMKSHKVSFGAPHSAPHTHYQRLKAEEYGSPTALTLGETLENAVAMLGKGERRTGGECFVPLHIWRTASFQTWYRAQRSAGNRLDWAEVQWVFWVGPEKNIPFLWALHVHVWIDAENRSKTNEVIISRPDIGVICGYLPAESLGETKIALIREFRSPASNSECVVWELPGGSSFKPVSDPRILAAHELEEETGLKGIDPDRLEVQIPRQLASTALTHKAHLFSVELTADEMKWLEEQSGRAQGVIADTERTFVEIRTISEILADDLVDFSMLGMILSTISTK
jgi:ADP-ribose pyrophosphatase YjhB (NUDIX family)